MLHIHANKLVYCVIPGNNSELVKYAMKNAPHRKDKWQELTNELINAFGAPCHFKWQ